MSEWFYDNLYLVSDNLLTVSTDEVTAVEGQLGTVFPQGYETFVTRLGLGTYSDYVRVYLPSKILNEHREFQARWQKYYFWDAGHTILPKQRVIESIAVANTADGELIFHPLQPNKLYVLPWHDEKIYEAGETLEAALEWFCSSGILTEPITFRYFESWRDRVRIRLSAPYASLSFECLKHALLARNIHNHVEIDEDEGFLELFVKDFFGTISCFVHPNIEPAIAIFYDIHKQTKLLLETIQLLETLGFQVDDENAHVAGDTPFRPIQDTVDGSYVEQYARAVSEGKLNWNAMENKIQILRATNGMFILDGHHRVLVAQLAGVEIPSSAIVYRDFPGEWIPQAQGWDDVKWSGF